MHAGYSPPPTGLVLGRLAPWILWTLWNARNTLIFNKKQSTPDETLTKAITTAKEWTNAQSKASQSSRASFSPLLTITADTASVQLDGAWSGATQTAGLGHLITFQQEQWPQASTAPFVASPLVAEALALRAAINNCKELGIQKIQCESDSSQLIKAINDGNAVAEIYGIVADIIILSMSFVSISFVWIPREKNKVADSLAKQALYELSFVLNPTGF